MLKHVATHGSSYPGGPATPRIGSRSDLPRSFFKRSNQNGGGRNYSLDRSQPISCRGWRTRHWPGCGRDRRGSSILTSYEFIPHAGVSGPVQGAARFGPPAGSASLDTVPARPTSSWFAIPTGASRPPGLLGSCRVALSGGGYSSGQTTSLGSGSARTRNMTICCVSSDWPNLALQRTPGRSL